MNSPTSLTRRARVPSTSRIPSATRLLNRATAIRSRNVRTVGQIVKFGILPILNHEARIEDVITPPGGWKRLLQAHPSFFSLPIQDQLRLALMG
jgi:hypothetical protein